MTILRGLALKAKRALATSRFELGIGFAAAAVLALVISSFNEIIVQPYRAYDGVETTSKFVSSAGLSVAFIMGIFVIIYFLVLFIDFWTWDKPHRKEQLNLLQERAFKGNVQLNFALCWASCVLVGWAATSLLNLPIMGEQIFISVVYGAVTNILFLIGWDVAPKIKNRLSPAERRWRKFNAESKTRVLYVEAQNPELAEAEIMFVTAAERMMDLHGVNPLKAVIQADEWLEKSRSMADKKAQHGQV